MNWIQANRHNISVDLACKLRVRKLKHLPKLDKVRVITDFGPISSNNDGSMILIGEILRYLVGANLPWDSIEKKFGRAKVTYHHIAPKRKFPRGQIVQHISGKALDRFLVNYCEWIILTLHMMKNQVKAKLYEKGDAAFTIRKIKPFMKLIPYEPEVVKWSHGVIKFHFYPKISDKLKKLDILENKLPQLVYSTVGVEISQPEEDALHDFKGVVPTHSFKKGYVFKYEKQPDDSDDEEDSEETITNSADVTNLAQNTPSEEDSHLESEEETTSENDDSSETTDEENTKLF